MSEPFHNSEAQPRAHWLVGLEPSHLHAWMLRAATRQPHDLLPSAPPGGSSPEHLAREAFIDWCAAGIELFLREGVGLPSRRTIDDAAHRVMLLAVLRHQRSITGAAQALETSRRALRDTMKRLGLYERWQRWAGHAPAGEGRAAVDDPGWSSSDPARPLAPLGDPSSMPSSVGP